jgi:hypothetical protein
MSLVIVTAAAPDFVGSAWLVAVTCTVAGEGRSPGAVYTPVGVIVPTTALPPAMPFTFQETLVSTLFVTVALKLSWLPSTTDPLFGVTVTTREGGGGGGGEPAPPPPQPNIHVPAVRRVVTTMLAARNLFTLLCGKGRIPAARAGEGPANRKGSRG